MCEVNPMNQEEIEELNKLTGNYPLPEGPEYHVYDIYEGSQCHDWYYKERDETPGYRLEHEEHWRSDLFRLVRQQVKDFSKPDRIKYIFERALKSTSVLKGTYQYFSKFVPREDKHAQHLLSELNVAIENIDQYFRSLYENGK